MRNSSNLVRGRAVRCAAAAALAVLALPIAGCGQHNLVLKVDVASYLSPSEKQVAFGPIPAVPGGISTGEQDMVAGKSINMVGNFGDVASVNAVSLRVAIQTFASSGGGSDTLRLYLSDTNTDPRTTAPVLVEPVTFTQGVTDTVVATFDGDARVLDLFKQKQMQMTLTTSLQGPSSGSSLSGQLDITGIDAVLVAGRKGTNN